MDVNETIVQAWLETQTFLVRRRLRYDLSGGKWSSVSDVDIVAYNPSQNRRVAVLVTAWMTQTISPSHLKPNGVMGRKLEHFLSPQADKEIRAALNVGPGQDYERWLVLSRISPTALTAIQGKGIKVIKFDQVMQDLIEWVKGENKWFPHESETLQTIRALVWTNLL